MKHILALAVLLCFSLTASAEDVRLQPLEDLNGYFPFNPPESLDQWEPRKEYVRRQILVAAGLWPMPTKTPLNAVVHGKIDREGYTVLTTASSFPFPSSWSAPQCRAAAPAKTPAYCV